VIKNKIVLIPGSVFSEAGENYVYLSYSIKMEKLILSMKYLEKYLIENGKKKLTSI
jgi:aspartate/methionine/tyrosine aminotransferase